MAREPTSQLASSRAEPRAKCHRARFEPSFFRAFFFYSNEPSRAEPGSVPPLAGADVNAKDSPGLTLIHFAIHFGRNASKHSEVLKTRQIIQLLIQNGACSNKQNIYGQSPDEITLSQKKIEMVKFINWCKSQV